MQSSLPKAPAAPPPAVAKLQHGRYRLEHILGEGGMAVVYQAVDVASGKTLALKRLRASAHEAREPNLGAHEARGPHQELGGKQAAFAALFEREFLALSQLKHPRIVEVYDYHVDDEGPYYTMELLQGGDLHRVAPVEYRNACALAYDVCSALSLVHSRRMVYRDLSPNNVRRTSDGLAKLIDFGALAPMGPSRDLVGTLPCVAPEALSFAALDARTDLFALGATLYFALVRRHAFPGRNAEELMAVWKRPLLKPSELVSGIPAALDQLVLSLLELDPERRPGSAGEVMERLAAIAELAPDEHVQVREAYLATPALVGRDATLEAVRAHAQRAKAGLGVSLCLSGAPGVGRSRMLDASGLEAKRLGMIVLRADAHDAQQGDYGVVRALARAALTQVPTLARQLAEPRLQMLQRVIPELRSDSQEQPDNDQDLQDLHRQLQPALRQWFCDLAAHCPLLIAVDDLERIDAPSAAFVGLMARDVPRQPLLLIAAQTTGVLPSPALRAALNVYARLSSALVLEPLALALTEKLLGSLFGEVPNLSLLAQHVDRITKGNPRAVLQLSEHLVSEGVIRYQSGSWSLPDRLSAKDLPSSMAQALERRCARLSADARLLCYGLSREPSWAFGFEDCAQLLNQPAAGAVMKCLNELVGAEFLEHAGGAYSIAQSALGISLEHGLSAAARQAVHLCLAKVCAQHQDAFRAAQHLLRAGQQQEGLKALVEFALESVQQTDANPRAFQEALKNLPANWVDTIDQALAMCDRERRPAREKRALLNRLIGLAGQTGAVLDGFSHVRTLLTDLSVDAGLDCFADGPGVEDPRARIQAALGRALARHQARSEDERVTDPVATLPELAKAVTAAIGLIAFTSSYADWKTLPSLAPLVPLSPSLALVQSLMQGMGLRLEGRSEASIAVYETVLARLAQPDRAGLPVSHHRHIQVRVLGAVAVLEAAMGKRSVLARAATIAEEPRYESMALNVRHLYQLFQGDLREAKRTKQQLELLRLESNAHHASEAQHMFLELNACALAQDMTGVKRALAALAPCEPLYVGFRAAAHYGRCEYQRMRGDLREALAEIEAGLGLMRAGEHLLWAHAASSHLRVLLELSRVDEACALGEVYLRAGESLGVLRNHVRAAYSVVLLRKGEHQAAAALADQAVNEVQRQGSTGLNLAVMCEARAQIAALLGDKESYAQHAALFAAQWPNGTRRLQAEGAAQDPASVADLGPTDEEALAQLRSTWETCHTVGERIHTGLEALARYLGALGGVLFMRSEIGLTRAASIGESAKDAALDAWAIEYFAREVTAYVTEEVTAEIVPPPPPVRASLAELAEYVPVLLGHNDELGYAVTGVVVLVGADRNRAAHPTGIAAALSRCLAEMAHVVSEYL